MPDSPTYLLLANAVLVLHLGVVLFVIGGLLLVLVGNLSGWRWVNRLWFRIAHLAAIATVVAQSWFGIMCPLTSLESWLRSKAGAAPASEGFIEHWVEFLLYYDAPTWVFTLAYTAFGALVAAAWWWFPPQRQLPKPGDRSPSI
jgi:hypothetical protein